MKSHRKTRPFHIDSYALDANLPYADDFHPQATELADLGSAEHTVNHGNLSNDTNTTTTTEQVLSRSAAENEYNRILSDINEKHREEEEINAILQDWKLLAQKVDCFLFWVFLCLTTVSSCVFIFILPYYKRGTLL